LHDFHNQEHIVLGKHKNCKQELVDLLEQLYRKYYPDAEISQCDSNESECMKIFVNNFYASKIQLFNEYYALCQKSNINYDNVKDLMLKNKWINPMHTTVPGTDGKLSYGGYCFPKDTNALYNHMKRKETPNKVLEAVIEERDEMRDDNDNCKED
jgi:UDPglucose 6-dehydrogenase